MGGAQPSRGKTEGWASRIYPDLFHCRKIAVQSDCRIQVAQVVVNRAKLALLMVNGDYEVTDRLDHLRHSFRIDKCNMNRLSTLSLLVE